MVEVFKTNIRKKQEANRLLKDLSKIYPAFRINFDLEDCDKILRVEGKSIQPKRIIQLVTTHGYQCKVLE